MCVCVCVMTIVYFPLVVNVGLEVILPQALIGSGSSENDAAALKK